MTTTRSCFAAAVLDGMIYAIGGYGPAHMNRYLTYAVYGCRFLKVSLTLISGF